MEHIISFKVPLRHLKSLVFLLIDVTTSYIEAERTAYDRNEESLRIFKTTRRKTGFHHFFQ
jgi:predicted small secreted protein